MEMPLADRVQHCMGVLAAMQVTFPMVVREDQGGVAAVTLEEEGAVKHLLEITVEVVAAVALDIMMHPLQMLKWRVQVGPLWEVPPGRIMPHPLVGQAPLPIVIRAIMDTSLSAIERIL